MSKLIVTPNPQKRYLEPYKNRTFQYDNEYSNLYLSQYVNNILRAVGNDVIVRGLQVDYAVDEAGTGVNFNISPGAVIQDTTYIELPVNTKISIDDIVSYTESFKYIILYTCWKYVQTVYANDFAIGVTLYDPRANKTLTAWDVNRNRIILGIYQYEVENGKITNVYENDSLSDITLKESNIVVNGLFPTNCDKWTVINSSMHWTKTLDNEDSFARVIPNSSNTAESGFAQVIHPKDNKNYKVVFTIRSATSKPVIFNARIIDGSNIYEDEPVILGSKIAQVKSIWTTYEIMFKSISPNACFILTKKNTDNENNSEYSFDVEN